VMNSDGSQMRQLTHGGAQYAPDFSPDGQRIVFARLPGWPNNWDGHVDTWIMNADGSGQHRVNRSRGTPTWFGSGPDFSPDGQSIVFERLAHYVPNIFVMNSDGSHRRQVTHEKKKTFESPEPDWQPLP
jgi:Tol biopolymer transport system component